MADENSVAAGRCAQSLHIERTSDGNAADAFEERSFALSRQDAFRQDRVLQKGGNERFRAGFDRYPDFEMRIRFIARAIHTATWVGSNREPAEPPPVESQIELPLSLKPHNSVE